MTAVLAVKGISNAWVEYGTTPALGTRADDMRHGLLPLNGRVHRLRMSGLSPGTTYFYRVCVRPIAFNGAYKITAGEVVATPTYSFRTLSPSGATRFCVINDTHERAATLAGVTTRLAEAKPQLTFWNGDIFDDVRSDEQIVQNVMRPAGAPYAASAPVCFVSGNHDVRGIHARSLEQFVQVPGGTRHHVIRHGPIAFIVLDTGEDKPDSHAVYAGLGAFERYRQEQAQWLAQAIEHTDVRSAPLRVVMQHIPMWGDGASLDSRAKWAELLARARVSAMICGHTHQFLFTPTDAQHPYPQLVGGGPAPESATVIEGHAEGATLSLVVRNLGGSELGRYEIKGS